MKVGITVKTGLKDPKGYVKSTVQYLKRQKVEVDLCEGTCQLVPNKKPSLDFKKVYDVILVFGGDGTMLRTLQYMKNFETAVLPINMGRLGFFSEAVGKDYKKLLERLLSGKYLIDSRMLLRCTVMRGKRRAFSKRALNEVTMARDALARMVSLKAKVNDLKLTTYVADGLIVSSPTGSTGYSLSSGGPIVHPDLDSIILTPISPHSFTQKPIIIPPQSRLKVNISSGEDRVYVTMDGQNGFHLKDGDEVKIKRSSKRLKIIRMSKSNYYATLRKKLHWGSDLAGR